MKLSIWGRYCCIHFSQQWINQLIYQTLQNTECSFSARYYFKKSYLQRHDSPQYYLTIYKNDFYDSRKSINVQCPFGCFPDRHNYSSPPPEILKENQTSRDSISFRANSTYRQRKPELRALSFYTAYMNFAAMHFHELPAQEQSQSSPLFVTGSRLAIDGLVLK